MIEASWLSLKTAVGGVRSLSARGCTLDLIYPDADSVLFGHSFSFSVAMVLSLWMVLCRSAGRE